MASNHDTAPYHAANGDDDMDMEKKRPKSKPHKKWPATWKFALVTLVICVAFNAGLLIGLSRSGMEGMCAGSISKDDGQLCKERVDFLKSRQTRKAVIRTFSESRVDNFKREFGSEPVISGSAEDEQKITLLKTVFNSVTLSRQHSYAVQVSLPGFAEPNYVNITDTHGSSHVFDLQQSTVSALRYPYVAFSPPGAAQGRVVDVESGSQRDFDHLAMNNISLSNAVALMKIGEGTSLKDKVLRAERAGAVAVLLHPDRATSVSCSDQVPTVSINEGGDPHTPGQPSIDGVPQKLRTQGLPRIPSQTISCIQADVILDAFQDGPVMASIETYNRYEQREVVNVLSAVPGDSAQAGIVVVGANRNSLHSYGALGTAALVEMWRAVMAEYIPANNSWSPQRTILFASWGGGDFGNIGVVEYLEEMQAVFGDKVVAYIDLDPAAGGNDPHTATTNAAMATFVQNVTAGDLGEVYEALHPVTSVKDPCTAAATSCNPWLDLLHTSYVKLHCLQEGDTEWEPFSISLTLNTLVALSLADDEVLRLDATQSVTTTFSSIRLLLADEQLNPPQELHEVLLDDLASASRLLRKLSVTQNLMAPELYNSKLLAIQRECRQMQSVIMAARVRLSEQEGALGEEQRARVVMKLLAELVLRVHTLERIIMNTF